jgi:AraC family transcriptional regulator
VDSKHPLIIDPTELQDVQQALPCLPTLQSGGTDNRGMLILHYDQHPAHAVPEYATPHHVLPIWGVDSQAEIEARLDDRTYCGLFGKGACGIIPAHFTHWAVWDQAIALTVIFLHPAFVEQVALEVTNGTPIELIPKHNADDPVLSQLGQLLKLDLEAGHPSGRLYQDSIATALAARLVSHHAVCPLPSKPQACGLSHARLQVVISYIQEHLNQEIRLMELAALVGLSEYYLCRSFKQSMGVSLHQYVIQQRVERAKHLLKRRDLTIAHIAQECGFSSHSHLSQQFKRYVGVSPKALRLAPPSSERSHPDD